MFQFFFSQQIEIAIFIEFSVPAVAMSVKIHISFYISEVNKLLKTQFLPKKTFTRVTHMFNDELRNITRLINRKS